MTQPCQIPAQQKMSACGHFNTVLQNQVDASPEDITYIPFGALAQPEKSSLPDLAQTIAQTIMQCQCEYSKHMRQ